MNNPLNETLFPPEMPPISVEWSDGQPGADTWKLQVAFPGLERPFSEFTVSQPRWTPSTDVWLNIKQRSTGRWATLTILGYSSKAPDRIISRGAISFSTSTDEVGASLFYREVNLPFLEAVKDPSQIRWRFGSISSAKPPPVVLEHLPVCGNCHSFSSDGRVMGMDVDYANSKGSYVVATTGPQMALAPKDIITWDDYRREDGELTFGLLSQVSPNGQYVVSTVKDKSVFVPRPDLAFSQLFFPIKGILALYNRQTKSFASLPGADDPAYVQSNPVWSPDGRYLVFARAKAYNLSTTAGQGKVLLTPDECREFTQDGKPFRFELYRLPFNEGRGGTAEPLEGAAGNDQSNYFPRYSPNGKWIVFCRAANYMLLQPDSQLYIISSSGGAARRLSANTARMNSWHSWSPNSRWLVFSSKVNSPYTQLFLTHIDDQGESTPPVCLAHLTAPDRAANIPEFVNLPPDGIVKIDEHFLNDYSFERAGNEFYRGGDPEHAITNYRQALDLNPENGHAHQRLGFLLYNVKHQFDEGLVHTREALRLDPKNALAHSDLAVALLNQRQPEEARIHLQAALRFLPLNTEAQYQPQALYYTLGQVCLQLRRYEEASTHLAESVRLAPSNPEAHYLLGLALALQGQTDPVEQQCAAAMALKPQIDTSVTLHEILAANFAKAGRLDDAIRSAERALELARATGNAELAQRMAAGLRK
jgi:tetratricopeptide (TPR) repeat protein